MADGIAITGSGLITALGTGTAVVHDALAAGECGLRAPPDDDPRFARGVDPDPRNSAVFGGFVQGFRPAELIRSKQLRRMDWFSRLILGATRLAAEDAALPDVLATRPERVAIVTGSCFGPQRETAQYMNRVLDRGLASGQPFLFPNLVLNAAAGWGAIEFDVQGANLTVSAHEASGESALVAACDLLLAQRADAVIVAAAEEFGDVLLDTLDDRRLLDPRVRGGAAPGSGNRTVVPGEAGVALILERASHARARGAGAQAFVLGAELFGMPAHPHAFPDAASVAERVDAWRKEISPRHAPTALFGGTCGGAARTAIDAELSRICVSGQSVELRASMGECPVHGLAAAALAAHTCARSTSSPLANPDAARNDPVPDQQILIVGAGRGGQIAPVLIGCDPSHS